MKLAILSRRPDNYSTRRLVLAAKLRGHHVDVLDTLKFSIELAEANPRLFYCSKLLAEYDAVIPRIAASITHFGTAVVRQFEQMDVFCANSSQGISNSRDKLSALQILSRHQIGMPPTTFVRNQRDVIPAIRRLGGAPVVIKLLEGTHGVGVVLAESEGSAATIIETMQRIGQNVLVQKFVSESRGRDIRAFVVGDRVVASMRRIAKENEFRSNVHRGARTEMVDLSESDQEMAVRAAQIMGLRVAGVDILESKTGPQIMEVNSSPGLEGIEFCTQLDVAGAVIEYLAEQVGNPQIDLRQRLASVCGYGVKEIELCHDSKMAGKTIDQSGLSEKDINVLTINRGTSVIPNPRLTHQLESGDRLLCYGNLATMRGLTSATTQNQYGPPHTNLEFQREAA